MQLRTLCFNAARQRLFHVLTLKLETELKQRLYLVSVQVKSKFTVFFLYRNYPPPLYIVIVGFTTRIVPQRL